ncbi:thrombospondin type 3 repeat-containing protein [Fibrobacterales bacterium]|nr:thrombospondin type 3 repeat-containing protein [Fibrobacterales bacterium]
MKKIKLCFNAPYYIKPISKRLFVITTVISVFCGLANSTPLGISVQSQVPIYDDKEINTTQKNTNRLDSISNNHVTNSVSLNWPLGIWGTHMILHSNFSAKSMSSLNTGVGVSLQLPLELQPWNAPTWIKFYYDTQNSSDNYFESWKDINTPDQPTRELNSNWTFFNISVTGRSKTIPYIQSGFSFSWLLGIQIPSKRLNKDQIYDAQITPFYKWTSWGVSFPNSINIPKYKRDGVDLNISSGFDIHKYFNKNWNLQTGIHYKNEIFEKDVTIATQNQTIILRPAQIFLKIELRYNLSDLTSADPDLDKIETSKDCCPFLAEDYDGYLDDDGCPDYDNDGDGIKDEFDNCPFNAEDFDLFEDSDGCPEVDNDNDQIFDSKDKCPNNPEDYDNFEDFDGCPDLDNDNDSIPDNFDKCMFDKEDKDGYRDLDGCPDFDNDLDGVPDSLDNCPLSKEDMDHFQDEDGCPDFDNDQDGIMDSIDFCPNLKESFNGFVDHDGCPDILRKNDTLFRETILFKKDQFGNDHILTPINLDKIKSIKNKYPNSYIQLTSRASIEGKNIYNLNLSRKRSSTIQDLIILHTGWSQLKIYNVYLGEEFPISHSKHELYHHYNRSTDILIIKK